MDARKAFSDIEIEKANQAFDQVISSRLNSLNTGGICLIQQRLRTDDMTGHLVGKKETDWVLVKIPMRYRGEQGFDAEKDLGPEYAHLKDPRTTRDELMFPEQFNE